MTAKESNFIARKYVKENIYGLAKIELPHITFPQTEEILEKSKLYGVNSEDVLTVINLKTAWSYIVQNIASDITKDVILKLHAKIAYNQALDWGVLRYGQVGITGTDYTPIDPREEPGKLEELFNNTLNNFNMLRKEYPIEATLDYLTSAIKSQFFWDGNKRTALATANIALLQSGNGVIGINDDNFREFSKALTHYYNTDNKNQLINILYNSCINTYHFDPNNTFNFNDYTDAKEKLCGKKSEGKIKEASHATIKKWKNTR